MRKFHRWLASIAAVFLLYVSITGVMLALDNVAVAVFLSHRGSSAAAVAAGDNSAIADRAMQLGDAEFSPMLRATLDAAARSASGAPLKAIRLRIFGGMRQGVMVTGEGDDTRQLVVNTDTAARAALYEEGYPHTGFPLGWDIHETVKRLHRGDFFGLGGRWIDLAAGLSLAFLSVSGLWMYVDLWSRRRRAGRKAMFWR